MTVAPLKTPTDVVTFTDLSQVGPDVLGYCNDDAVCLALLTEEGLLGKVTESPGFKLCCAAFTTPTHYVMVNLHHGYANPVDNGYTAAALKITSFTILEANQAFNRILNGLNPSGRMVAMFLDKPQFKA